MVDKANLEDRDLFLFNSTVIAGALIFLTISTIATTREESFFRLEILGGDFAILSMFTAS